jgi:hypothetical protein
MPYKFSEALQRELDGFNDINPALVADEIKIIRLLIQRALEQNNPGLVATLSAVLAKLSSIQVSNAARIGAMLDRSELIRMGQRLSTVLVERLSGLPNYEQVADVPMSDIQRVFQERERTLTVESTEPATQKEADILPYGKLTP